MSVQESNDAAAAELLRWTQRQDSEVLTTEDMESLAMNHDQVRNVLHPALLYSRRLYYPRNPVVAVASDH